MERKKAKVHMLPTNSKSSVLANLYEENKLSYNVSLPHGSGWAGYQYLYFTTDEKIKEDDLPCWGLNGIDIGYLSSFTEGAVWYEIIASTDPELIGYIPGNRREADNGFSPACYKMPKPSQSFIEKYCKLGGIDEVDVECEYEYGTQSNPGYFKPKIDSHNTITIHSIKDSWDKEELIIKMKLAFNEGLQQEASVDFNFDLDKWIEENL